MKKFVYIVNKKNNDRNGNPRSTVRVYRVKEAFNDHDKETDRLWPLVSVYGPAPIGYRSDAQAVIDGLIIAGEITEAEITDKQGRVSYSTYQLRSEFGIVIQEISAN